MRSTISKAIVIATAFLSFTSSAFADESARVLMFVKDGARDLDLMLTSEVGVMRDMLEKAGYTVDIVTATGEPMRSESAELLSDVALSEVDISDYAGFIMPCMAPASGHPVPQEVVDIMEAAVELDLPIAASRGSVATLAMAGGVADRDYAFASPVDIAERPEFAGGNFLGTGVVRDGNVSTAGICPLASRELNMPDGTVELTQSFIDSLAEAS